VSGAPDAPDLSAQLQQVRSGCDAVLLAIDRLATIPLMADAAAENVNVRWLGLDPTWVSLLATGTTGSYMAEHFWLAAHGPQWGDPSVPGMKRMLGDVARFKPGQRPDLSFAFGYAEAFTVARLLEKAVSLGDLSREGIFKALNRIGTIDTLGLAGTYTYGAPNHREAPDTSTIFAVEPAVPGGLRALSTNVASGPAQHFRFP
jgi:ABC-type branched-subunit amino acid transport system substrate-binding protein